MINTFSFSVTIIISDSEEPVTEVTMAEFKPDVQDPEENDFDFVVKCCATAKRRRLGDSEGEVDKRQKLCHDDIKMSKSPIVKSESFGMNFHGFSVDTSELFCRSLIPTMKCLNKCAKSVARLMIQRTLHTVQFGDPTDAVAPDIREMIESAQSGMPDSKEDTSSVENEDELFCLLSLAPIMRQMSIEKQSLTKFKIQEVLHKCQF